ncbi:MAG: hypothetical protein ACRDVG_14655 [Jatrophihabitantaceae bacterium]
MTAPSDPRAVAEFRVPAAELKAGDLVNTSPGEGDWQQVTGVYRSPADTSSAGTDLKALVAALGGRYVVVQLTDLLPVDGGIYFSAGTAMVAGDDEGDDLPVTDAVSGEDGERVYLYTRFELVTVRPAR